MAAIRREIKEVEAQLDLAEKDFTKINDRLRIVQQDRSNVEEELAAQNTRLKQMLDELALRKEQAEAEGQGLDGVGGSKMTMAELDRKVDAALLDVLEAKFRDEAFATAIIEQSAATGGDKVRVEFEGDEVFWTLQENYTFEMLLMDAARYWDVSPQDAVLADERGAVWPDDAYVALELQSAPAARIALRIKATATVDDDEAEYYGREDNGSDISEEEEQDFMAIAEAAEDELLLAQARGGVASLTNKQKIALKRKMKRELGYFVFYAALFVYVLYARRQVENGFFMQQSISTAFVDEAFGDYNEKTFEDVATAEEAFDWMAGPLSDGLFPDELYNGLEVPADKRGYVMSYNKVVGKVRLRQLRVLRDGCKLSQSVFQSGTLKDGTARQRQLVDYCFPQYTLETMSDESFGPEELQEMGRGFMFTTEKENNLEGSAFQSDATSTTYDGGGFVLDLDGANRTAYLETLDMLKTNRWVDRQTRAILITLNLYNGNYDYLCRSVFVLEFTPGGSVITSQTQRVLTTDMYTDEYWTGDKLMTSIPEMLLYFVIFCYLVHFAVKLGRTKKVTGKFSNHFRDPWNIVDVLWFGIMLTAGTMRMLYFVDPLRLDFSIFKLDYQELGTLAESYRFSYIVDAITILVIAVKAIKYFALQHDLALLKGTLAQAISDLSVFVVLLLVILLGFVMMASNIFGSQVNSYRNIFSSFGTLFLILLGEFDFDEMAEVSWLWATLFFILYVIFMFFVVLNIFLAILNDAYTVVHTEDKWEELEKRKPRSLREKFEVQKAMWRERKNLKYVKKLKKEKVKAAKKAKKAYEQTMREKGLMGKIGHRRRKAEAKEAADAGDDAVKQTRVQKMLSRAKQRPH